ncbi:hypothetical protein PR048_030961 [Dryococelus australis]|uniref:Uncharacterized protein n=1 Tax=Dryococelus australis TaxID=614101 RepID=A0ABQ9GAE4_9NEOP|nr:hypothetical protein PR048_030961 [Dryococelus australis]
MDHRMAANGLQFAVQMHQVSGYITSHASRAIAPPTTPLSYHAMSRKLPRANWVQSPAGTLRIFVSGNRAGRCRWSGEFWGISSFPMPLYSGAAPYSPHFTLIYSQGFNVKSCQNLVTLLRSPISGNCRVCGGVVIAFMSRIDESRYLVPLIGSHTSDPLAAVVFIVVGVLTQNLLDMSGRAEGGDYQKDTREGSGEKNEIRMKSSNRKLRAGRELKRAKNGANKVAGARLASLSPSAGSSVLLVPPAASPTQFRQLTGFPTRLCKLQLWSSVSQNWQQQSVCPPFSAVPALQRDILLLPLEVTPHKQLHQRYWVGGAMSSSCELPARFPRPARGLARFPNNFPYVSSRRRSSLSLSLSFSRSHNLLSTNSEYVLLRQVPPDLLVVITSPALTSAAISGYRYARDCISIAYD